VPLLSLLGVTGGLYTRKTFNTIYKFGRFFKITSYFFSDTTIIKDKALAWFQAMKQIATQVFSGQMSFLAILLAM
jgi:hypothetical protein